MGVPGLARIDHVGFTVPDIGEAHQWLVDVIGCEFLYSIGPFSHDGDFMPRRLNVKAETVIREVRLYRCGPQTILEVFNYEVEDQATTIPRNSDIGGHHIALYVDDVNDAAGYLKSRGVQVLGEPSPSSGPAEGQHWVYFLAPWGMQFELVSYPLGKAFDRDPTGVRTQPTDA
jgi:glyoxylase I family protein